MSWRLQAGADTLSANGGAGELDDAGELQEESSFEAVS